MRVLCRHGHFALYPSTDSDVFRFVRLFKLALVPEADYFTFAGLAGLPRWSQVARPYGTLPAVVTFEGRNAAEVMEANGFVYSLATGILVPYATITATVELPRTTDNLRAPSPLVQPGAVLSTGDRLMGYDGILNMENRRLYIQSIVGLLA